MSTATTRAIKLYGYCRESSILSIGDQSESIQAQEKTVLTYIEYLNKSISAEFGYVFKDPGVSGAMRFVERPAGKQLDDILERGDYLIFSRYDRAFRDVADGLQQYELWKNRGIVIVFLDLRIDTSTPIGEYTFTTLLAAAKLERQISRDRMNAGIRRCYNRGEWLSNGLSSPYGYKLAFSHMAAGKKRYKLVPDPDIRAWGRYFIALLKVFEHESVVDRWLRVNKVYDPGVRRHVKPRVWSVFRIARYMRLEEEMQMKEAVTGEYMEGVKDKPDGVPDVPAEKGRTGFGWLKGVV